MVPNHAAIAFDGIKNSHKILLVQLNWLLLLLYKDVSPFIGLDHWDDTLGLTVKLTWWWMSFRGWMRSWSYLIQVKFSVTLSWALSFSLHCPMMIAKALILRFLHFCSDAQLFFSLFSIHLKIDNVHLVVHCRWSWPDGHYDYQLYQAIQSLANICIILKWWLEVSGYLFTSDVELGGMLG